MNAQRLAVLDPYTLALLRTHIGMINPERAEFGPDYAARGLLFWADGRPEHLDTIAA